MLESTGSGHRRRTSYLGGRVAVPGAAEYIEYVSDEQFAPLARELALVAAERVRHYRDVLPTVAAAASVLMRAGPDALLDAVNAGIAFGLADDPAAARMMFAVRGLVRVRRRDGVADGDR